jgi:hypothetical protein
VSAPAGRLDRDRYLDPSGAVLGGGSRHAMDFEYRGRRWAIPVERDAAYDFTIPATAAWSDGTPVEPDAVELAVHCIEQWAALTGQRITVFRPGRAGA